MFPQLNQIFRPKNKMEIANLKISKNNKTILENVKINLENVDVDENDNLIITEMSDKLEIIGTHFEQIHMQNSNLGKERLNEIVKREVEKLKKEINEEETNKQKLVNFSQTNSAENPNEYKDYFTNIYKLIKTFSQLNNKKSSGPDEIPNIVLKNLPNTIIQ